VPEFKLSGFQIGDLQGVIGMREVHEEEQNRYTLGFFLFVLILLASVVAASIKALLVWLGQ